MLAKREQYKVIRTGHEIVDPRRRVCGDDVEFHSDLAAVRVEWKIIDILAERVLDFAADCGETEDDVCGH